MEIYDAKHTPYEKTISESYMSADWRSNLIKCISNDVVFIAKIQHYFININAVNMLWSISFAPAGTAFTESQSIGKLLLQQDVTLSFVTIMISR